MALVNVNGTYDTETKKYTFESVDSPMEETINIKFRCGELLQAEIDPSSWRIPMYMEINDGTYYSNDIFNLIYWGYPNPQTEFIEGNMYDCFKLILNEASYNTSGWWRVGFLVEYINTSANAYTIDKQVGIIMSDEVFRKTFPKLTLNLEYGLNLKNL